MLSGVNDLILTLSWSDLQMRPADIKAERLDDRVYAAQEGAILREYHLVLQKILSRGHDRARDIAVRTDPATQDIGIARKHMHAQGLPAAEASQPISCQICP